MLDDHDEARDDETGEGREAPPASPWASPEQPSAAGDPTLPPPAVAPPHPAEPGPVDGSAEMVVAPAPAAPTRSPLPWLLASIVGIALLAGAAWFAFDAMRATSGAASPDDAVTELFAAIANEDALALAELIEPDERRTLVEPTFDEILPELQRLGVLDDIDLSAFPGVDIEFDGIEYELTETEPGLQVMRITGGTSDVDVTGSELPVGSLITDRMDDAGDLDDLDATESSEMATGDEVIALVERDGRWYVSIWYTVAENLRLEAALGMPPADDIPRTRGAESPEAAVEQFVRAAVELDLEAMAFGLDPAEMSALHRYWPAFADDAATAQRSFEAALDEIGGRITVTDFEFDVDRDGDDAIVSTRAFTLDLEAVVDGAPITARFTWSPTAVEVAIAGTVDGVGIDGRLSIQPRRIEAVGTFDDPDAGAPVDVDLAVDLDPDEDRISVIGMFDGEPLEGYVDFDADDGCHPYRLVAVDVDEEGCLVELIGDERFTEFVADSMTSTLDSLPDEIGGIPLATHRTDGEWFVSPTGTMMHAITSWLGSIERTELEETIDTVMGLVENPLLVGDFLDEDVVFDDDSGFDPAQSLETSERVEVAEGETVTLTGVLEVGEARSYVVDVPAGATVGVSLYGADLVDDGIADPYLTVDDPDGSFVTENDDADGLNSALQFTADDRVGAWSIVVSDLYGGPGGFQLTIEVAPPGERPSVGGDGP